MTKISYQPSANRVNKYTRKDWETCSTLARIFLAEHPKPRHYYIEGETDCILFQVYNEERDECFALTYLPYTDEEVNRIKELLLEVYNGTAEQPAATYEQMPQDDISALYGKNKELDALLWDRAAEHHVFATRISLDNPLKFYEVTYVEYDMEKRAFEEERHANLCLSDEQYLYLLTEMLFSLKTDIEPFTFMDLARYNPAFAQYLADTVRKNSESCVLIFDEIYNDAVQIAEENMDIIEHEVRKRDAKTNQDEQTLVLTDEVLADRKIDEANKAFKAEDYFKAFPVYEELAKSGNPRALFNCAICYQNGLGVAKNEKKALTFFLKAAKRGYPYAFKEINDVHESKGKLELGVNGRAILDHCYDVALVPMKMLRVDRQIAESAARITFVQLEAVNNRYGIYLQTCANISIAGMKNKNVSVEFYLYEHLKKSEVPFCKWDIIVPYDYTVWENMPAIPGEESSIEVPINEWQDYIYRVVIRDKDTDTVLTQYQQEYRIRYAQPSKGPEKWEIKLKHFETVF